MCFVIACVTGHLNVILSSLRWNDCQGQKHSRRSTFGHKGEKYGIKIQGQELMFTQQETRTWHILGSWICEFKAFRPTSNSTVHNFPLAGRSGMPEQCLMQPPAPALDNSAGRTHRWRVKGSALTATTHVNTQDTFETPYLMLSSQRKTAVYANRKEI